MTTTQMDEPAVFRAPLSSGEFIAQWPQTATSQDFASIKAMLLVVIDAWRKNAQHQADTRTAGEIEYASWSKP